MITRTMREGGWEGRKKFVRNSAPRSHIRTSSVRPLGNADDREIATPASQAWRLSVKIARPSRPFISFSHPAIKACSIGWRRIGMITRRENWSWQRRHGAIAIGYPAQSILPRRYSPAINTEPCQARRFAVCDKSWRNAMAKGQMRSNREQKKPKKQKAEIVAPLRELSIVNATHGNQDHAVRKAREVKFAR